MNISRQADVFMDHTNMATDFNDIIKEGYIRLKGKRFGQWRKVFVRFRRASYRGPQRLEKYKTEITDSTSPSNKTGKVIPLKNVEIITRLPRDIKDNALAINFADGSSRMFACESEFDVNEWKNVLEQECFPPFSDDREGSLFNGNIEIKDTYHVKLLPTPNLEVNGECLMQITDDSIHLYDINNHTKLLVTWPLNALRKYGRDETKFTFEAGRFCPTGEGIFIFRTVEGEKIHQKVHTATIAIAVAHQRHTRNLRNPVTPTRSLPPVPTQRVDRPLPVQHSISNPEEQDKFPDTPPPPPPRPDMVTRQPISENGILTGLIDDYTAKGNIEHDGHDDANNDYDRTGFHSEIAPSSHSAMSRQEDEPSQSSHTIPVPPPAHTLKENNNNKKTAAEDDDDDEEEVIYEEKYLAAPFRKFLKSRKVSEES